LHNAVLDIAIVEIAKKRREHGPLRDPTDLSEVFCLGTVEFHPNNVREQMLAK
jgi:hypothetical protein